MCEALRGGCSDCTRGCLEECDPCWKLDHFGMEAADLIEKQQAEIKQLREQLKAIGDSFAMHLCELCDVKDREIKRLKGGTMDG